MEILLVLAIFLFAVLGLGLGLMLGRAPLRAACCAGMSCARGAACEGCPRRAEQRP